MMNFLRNLNYKFQIFMQGRYGTDELSKTLLISALIVLLISSVPVFRILYPVALLFVILSYMRCFSKNSTARNKELTAYYKFKNKLAEKISLRKKIWAERKTHRYFKCKKCGAVWRVPKGKGKIEITCRSCKNKMIKKS